MLFTALVLGLFSCGKNNDPAPGAASDLSQIKAVGYRYVTSSTIENIVLSNSQITGYPSLLQRSKMFVKGSDVYFISVKTNPDFPNDGYKAIAGYYKNGTFNQLGFGYVLTDILVDDNDNVYVCGYDNKVGGGSPVYWKNGQMTTLLGSGGKTTSGKATNMVRSGNDIYIAGYVNGGLSSDLVCYWKNGTYNALTYVDYFSTGDYARIPLAVNGSDVYMVTYYRGVYSLWKNNTKTTITEFSNIGTIKFNNNKLYITGLFYENQTYKLGYTVDGVKTIITDTQYSQITDIAFKGEDVYFSGSLDNKAAIWKNTTLLNDPNDFTRQSAYDDLSF